MSVPQNANGPAGNGPVDDAHSSISGNRATPTIPASALNDGPPRSLRLSGVTHPGTGLIAALPSVSTDCPPHLLDGLARLHRTFLTGACDCGATFTAPRRRWARYGATSEALDAVLHAPDCLAGSGLLARLQLWAGRPSGGGG